MQGGRVYPSRSSTRLSKEPQPSVVKKSKVDTNGRSEMDLRLKSKADKNGGQGEKEAEGTEKEKDREEREGLPPSH